MAPIPKISIHGFTHDGPAYTIHRALSGWRNRKARRLGANANEPVGDHEAQFHDEPAASLVWAVGDTELWAFAAGHTYAVDLLVDGDAHTALVDALDDHRVETYRDGIQLAGWQVRREDEDGEIEQPSNISDGAESQDHITALNGAQIEQITGSSNIDDALTDEELEALTAPDSSLDDEDDFGDEEE